MSKHTTKFNYDIIEGVIHTLKEKFRAENKPDDVIDTLKKMWEERLKKAIALRNKRPDFKLFPMPIYIMSRPAYPPKKLDGNSSEEEEEWEKVEIIKKEEVKKEELKEEAKTEDRPLPVTELPKEVVDEPISSDSDDSMEQGRKSSIDKMESTDKIFAQYEEVHRAKKKFKCKFINVLMKLSSGDYVAPRATAEIDY